MLIEKSRECHNQKPQSIPDTKKKRKRTNINACKINAREAHKPAPSSPSEMIIMLKWLKKHEDKEQDKTKHEASSSINHKATQNKNNTETTALERTVA